MSVEELVSRCQSLLLERGETVATAESLTGGLLSAAFTAVRGASTVYRGGIVAYSVDLKAKLLGVPAEQLSRHGPVHPDTAMAMAVGVRSRLGATYGLATTGVAGPEPHGDQPVGTVDIAWAGADGSGEVRELVFSGSREEIRRQSVEAVLALLRSVLSAPRTT